MSNRVHAAQERYEYDQIGRLIRMIDGSNQVTDYAYDAAGNLTAAQNLGSSALLAPSISNISPLMVRQGQVTRLTLTGQRLAIGNLQTANPNIDFSNIQQTASQIQVDVYVAPNAMLGSQVLIFSNLAGSANISMTVGPVLPIVRIDPSPLAFPPDNVARNITVQLSNADVVPHTIGITSSNLSKLTIGSASASFAPGQTSLQISVAPKVAGFANITLTSATLQPQVVPVFVTTDFRGVSTSYAPPVGLLVGNVTPAVPAITSLGTVFAPSVGLSVGSVLTNILPRSIELGASQQLVVRGLSIPAAVQITVLPSDGITLGVAAVSQDGLSISTSITVDAQAQKIPRKVVVKTQNGLVIPFTDTAQEQLYIGSGQPEIWSVEPMYAKAGTSLTLKVRGKNLENGLVSITPSTHLSIDAQPSVDATGGEMTLGLQIDPLAANGLRTVQVTTLSGQTTAQANLSNSLTLVRQIQQVIPSIMAPAVGIVVGTPITPTPTSTTTFANALPVGIAVGNLVQSVNPKALVRGTVVNVVIAGAGFQSVQNIQIKPSLGLTLGTASTNIDGTQITIPVTVDAGADKSIRRLILTTANGPMLFAQAQGDQLLVSDPIPEIFGVSPQVIKAGEVSTLRMNGRYLGGATGLRFDPATDMTLLAPPTANADGTVLTANVLMAARATSGARTVIVEAGVGESSDTRVLGNTIFVARQVGATYDSIMAQPVGVTVQSDVIPVTTERLTIAPLVGVLVPAATVTSTNNVFVASQNVLVSVGPVITATSPAKPDGVLQGDSVNLVFSGQSLDQVTTVRIFDPSSSNTGATGSTPATSLTVGALTVNLDGTSLTAPVTVSNTAQIGAYRVALDIGSGVTAKRVPAVPQVDLSLAVGALPTINSISPIVMEQGKSYSLLIRGSQLQTVFEAWLDSASGVDFVSAPVWSTDTYGELITVSVTVKSDASMGSRVIRLRVPGGASSANPLPTNTITIFAPQ